MHHIKRRKIIKKEVIEESFGNIDEKNMSICDDFIKKKIDKCNKIMKIISCFAIICFICNFFDENRNIVIWRFVILVGLACLLFLYHFILIYRYEKGFYGTTYEEAKELLYFIKQNNNNNYTKGKKIFNEAIDKRVIPEDLRELLKE